MPMSEQRLPPPTLVFHLSPAIFLMKTNRLNDSFWEKLCTLGSKSLDMGTEMFFNAIAFNLGDLRFLLCRKALHGLRRWLTKAMACRKRDLRAKSLSC